MEHVPQEKMVVKAARAAMAAALKQVETSAAVAGVATSRAAVLHALEDAGKRMEEGSSLLMLLQHSSSKTPASMIPTKSNAVASNMLKDMKKRAKKWQKKARSIPTV